MCSCSPPKPQRSVQIVGDGKLVLFSNIPLPITTPKPEDNAPKGQAELSQNVTPVQNAATLVNIPSNLTMLQAPSKYMNEERGPSTALLPFPSLKLEGSDSLYKYTHSNPLAEDEIKAEPMDGDFHTLTGCTGVEAPSEHYIDLQIEGALVERSLHTSLPEVVSEVSRKQRDQSQEFTTLRLLLDKAKLKHSEIKSQLKTTSEDTTTVTRHIYLAEDDINKSNRLIDTITTEITESIEEHNRMQHELTQSTEELAEQQELFRKYREHMRSYVELVSKDSQSHDTVHKQLAEEKTKLQQLLSDKKLVESGNSEVQMVLDGTYINELNVEISRLKVEKQQMEKILRSSENELNNKTQKQNQLNQETEVLHKRNSAQLLRLKKQLKEMQGRNKQWNEQACQLDMSLSNIQAQGS